MDPSHEEETLARILKELSVIVNDLQESRDPVECVAQGHLEGAVILLERAKELLS